MGTGITDNGNGTAVLDYSTDGTFDIRYYYTDFNSCSDTITKTLVINPLPVVSVSGFETDYCFESDPDTLTGSYAPGGTFYGDNIADLLNGSALFTAAMSGVNTIHYTYSDINGCADTINLTATVHNLPVVSFIGVNPYYDISDPTTTLIGAPAGGTFTGHGVSGNTYNPALAGVRTDTVVYIYSDLNGCTNYDTAYTEVKDYDFKDGARIITDIDNWCSVDAVYSTIGATADETIGSCWSNGPNFNRWFKFQAPGTQVKVEVKTGGAEGTLRRPFAAIWDESGNQVACQTYYSDYSDITLGSPALTPGEWYYISVDNFNNTGYRGSFTLCVDDSVDYDFMEGAITVPHFNDWCSAEAEFSTLDATADRTKGSCWQNGPNYNRWFKFLATSSELTVDVKTGGTEGTLRRAAVALWDGTGNELACSRYTSDYDDVRFGYANLTPGTWYYLSVDNYVNAGYRGTFTLCIDNEVNYDFKEGAIELTDIHEWCSVNADYTTVEATPDGIQPTNWNSGPNYNRWFKFRATSSMVRAELKTGGAEGTLRYGLIAVWDSVGNEVSSARYTGEYSDVVISSVLLTPGDLYYISVDNYVNAGYKGTFSLCVTDTIGYDYKEGAIEIADINQWCSPEAIYSTVGATPDRLAGSTWPNGPNFNRWFTFTASTNQLKAELKTGGSEGTLRYGLIAIWDDADNEISSARYYSDYGDVVVSTNDLVPGQRYYISVDNYNNNGYRGTFSLCVDDTLDYDFREAAIVFDDLNYWCSGDAAYTTMDATPDGDIGSAWPNGPNFNRWFRFQATTAFVKVDMKTGGTQGTLRYPLLALWDSAGNEISSARYTTDYNDVTVGYNALVPGEWYFISADNASNTGYRGTFTMCITDTLDYDFKEGAKEITDIDDWCSADGIYTTLGATPDRLKGSAWNSGPNFNRWFKFQATTTMVRAEVKTGGLEGSMRYPYIAIWDENDNELSSARYTIDYDDIVTSSDTLTPGDWYYISVDNYNNTGYRGTFSLCVNDTLDYDFKAAAIELNDISNWCSPLQKYTTMNATPDEQAGSAWSSGPNYNRWFRFTATSDMVNIMLKTGGSEGTLRYPYLALWDAAGNEISSQRYYAEYSDINVSSDILVPGQTYFISVDNLNNLGYRGSFSLCVTDTVDYDFRSAAKELTDISSWCSPLQAYTTLGATPDEMVASCWNSGPNNNRWFKFRATTQDVTVRLLTGAEEGSLRYAYIALWDSAGIEKTCRRYAFDYSDLEITTDTFKLVVGNWYYISVDNLNNLGYRGTFSLCLDDKLSYDFKDGAELIADTDNWCSDPSAFSTVNATPDKSKASCWPNGPNFNRWFKFQATSSDIAVQLRTSGIEGNLRRGMLGLWDESLTEVRCQVYTTDGSDLELYSTSLTPGNWYFISADNFNNTGYRGTFTVCVTDHLRNDERSNAILLNDLNNWCSENAKYSNSIATPDESAGSCWTGAENKNVWFKFLATSNLTTIIVKTGADLGSMRGQQIALWDASGTEIDCVPANLASDTTVLVSNSLNTGDLYYVSVDDDGTSGTFTICIDDDVTYDYPEGALELTDIDNWCSPDAGFSNAAATLDPTAGSCWTGADFKNVWFKFQATGPEISISLKTGGAYGSMQRQQMALWNISGDEVACASWVSTQGTVVMQADSLVSGNWYWIGVDDDRVSGTFTLCLDDSVDYDYFKNAYTIADPRGWCSADAEFTNIWATDDVGQGSCWSGTVNKNVWFKFQATTPFIKIQVKTGSVYGDMQRQQVALFNGEQSEIGCSRWISAQGTIILQSDTLTPGNWYWIAVDDDYVSRYFTICTDDRPDYDFKAGALEITDISQWCSAEQAYSNLWATADQSMASCWLGTENKNVWFKFQATTRFININLRTGNVYGDMRRPQMALWNAAGVEVSCIDPVIDQGTLTMNSDSLTPGNWYYLSVDDNYRSGMFTLCFDDQPTYDYMEGAILLGHNSGCSTEALYTNYYATSDQSMGSCWSGTVNKNVWFKFVAQTNFLTLKLTSGNIYGTIRRPQMAIWRDDGTEVKCIGPVIDQGSLILSLDTLSIGDTYYISVDDNYVSGSFTLCLSDQIDYDYRAGAKILAHDAGCSANASYTNYYATEDETMASCWLGTVNKNVWFRFQALTPFATVKLKTGNVYGNMRRGQMAIWNADKQLVKCVDPVYDQGTTIMSIDSLTVGNWYWISVDDNSTSGSFTLCLDDMPDFDYRSGAIEIPHMMWCSANAGYTNAYATEDESMASCWLGTENKNVWFKFQAMSDFATIELKTGNVYGNLRRGQMALWKADGSEVKCVGPLLDQGTTSISFDSLVTGDWYYISVDDNYSPGTFTMCMSDQPDFDYKAGAVEIQHDAGCYPDAGFSNLLASPDRSQGSCWTGTENKNVWFKFQALTPELKVEISTGGVYGNMQRQQVSLWNEADVELTCTKWIGNTGTIILQTDTLTTGDWYYISVDDDRNSGSFKLCIDDQVDYDYRAGAIELTNISNWCSDDAEYTNLFATADRLQGSCWSGSTNKNVWFKFQAETQNIVVDVKTGTVYGTMRRQQLALWNEAGTEVGCAKWTASSGTVTLVADTLTAGDWYYISVDDDNTSGTFSLCLQGNPLDADISGTNVSCFGNTTEQSP